MIQELSGRRFGKLVAVAPTQERKHGAVLWRCRCDCGREVLVESRRLKPGVIRSCGCDSASAHPKDLTGQRFGRLVVTEKTEKRSKNRYVLWRCRCDCGNEIETTKDRLLSGNTTSCGCARHPERKDWVGRRFGNLVVEAYARKEKGSHLWRCRCDCGNQVEVRQSNLLSGSTTSCGCKHTPSNVLHFVDGTCVESIRSKTLSRANTSGVRGVYFNRKRGKWIAQIMFKGKVHYLGGYSRIEDAAKARREGEALFEEFLDWYQRDCEGKAESG